MMGAGAQKIVNGVVAGKKPSLSKQRRKRIRAAFYRLRDIREEDRESYVASLKGRVMYAASVNPDQAKSLKAALSGV